MRTWFRPSLRRVMSVALATAMSLSVVVGAPAAAAPPVTFGLSIGSCTVSGEAPSNLAMRLVHQDSSGHSLGHADVLVQPDGDWVIDCLPGGPINSGHRLVAKNGATVLRTLIVPKLSIRLDRATDVLKVIGPPGEQLHFVLDSCIPGYITCYGGLVDLLLQPDGTGHYQTTLASDARGGDRVRLEWNGPSDYFERLQFVPYLQVERGSSRVKGGAKPGTTVHLQLKRSDGTVRGTASDTADSDGGAWSTRFRRNGANVEVATGNRVKGDHASDGVLDIAATGVTIDPVADTVHGSCYPNGRFGVTFTEPGTATQEKGWGALGATGTFDLAGFDLVQSGWVARLWCASRKGDVLYRKSIVP
jgi:hypothetical protein